MKLSFLALTLFLAFTQALTANQLLKQKDRSGSNVIKLTNKNYKNILSGPRDSYIAVLLTATNSQVGCQTCMVLNPEYEKVANSWFQDHPNGDNLFFARADFADGQVEIFQAFQLQTVPKLYIYEPTTEKTDPVNGGEPLPIPQGEFASTLAAILGESTRKQIKIYEPFPIASVTISAIFTFVVVLVIKKNFHQFLLILRSKPLWGGVIVLSILLFITGYMFNSIRGVPYLRADKDGNAEYFVPGQQAQLGAETQIMSLVYGVLAFSVICLVTKIPTVSNPKIQFGLVLFLSALILVTFSILFSIFRYKSGGYPYHLLNIWSP